MKTVKPYTPIQYVMGRAEFCGLEFMVNEDVLIPRPETELLVQAVIDLINNTQHTIRDTRILDLCTGSGNIAIALTKAIADCKIVASDISAPALDCARQNARINGVAGRIEFVQSDLFDRLNGKFDYLVSNPPYIAEYEFRDLQKEVLMEPHLALDGGPDGLNFYKRIFSGSARYLNNGGYVVLEIGYGQLRSIKDIISGSKGFRCEAVKKDQNGIDRVVIAKWIN